MADSELVATLADAGAEVVLSIEIGDGLPGYWTVVMMEAGRHVRRWEGRSDDALPDEVRFPAAAFASGAASLTWSVLLYGPAHRVGYHVQVRLQQGGRDLTRRPARLSGDVAARQTRALSGVISVSTGPA